MHTLPARHIWFPALLIVAGTAILLQRLHVMWIGWVPLLFGIVTIAGAVRLYNGLAMKSRGGVFWGLFWCVLGGAGLLRSLDVVWLDGDTVVAGLFLLFGTGLVLMFLVSRRDWYLLVPAACCLLVGCAVLATDLGYLAEWDVVPVVNRWWPAGLVLSGAALILNGLPASSFRFRRQP
jgi:hypothetical protein